MAGVTGRPQRASTVALVALVGAELGQTLLDSHAPLVVLTALGSLAAMGTLISIPGGQPTARLHTARSRSAGRRRWAPPRAATVAVAVLNRVSEGWGSRTRRHHELRMPAPNDEPSDRMPNLHDARRATAAHRVPATAPLSTHSDRRN